MVKGAVSWSVESSKNEICECKNAIDSNIKWVPYICIYHSGDEVELNW